MSADLPTIDAQTLVNETNATPTAKPSALVRWGLLLVAPPRWAAASDPTSGKIDRWLLGIMYLVGAHADDLFARIAGLLATRDLNGVTMLASGLAWGLLPVVAALWLFESVLRRERAHHSGTLLVPLVLVAVLLHLADRLALGRVWLPTAWQADLLGIAWGTLLAANLRDTLASEAKPGAQAASTATDGDPEQRGTR